MRTNAAVLWSQPGKWEITEIELDPPKEGEVLVRLVATGLCHSDDHVATGDMPARHLPICGGHEGAGVVEEVGPAVQDLAPGDHVVFSFVSSCGRCRYCASGRQALCNVGPHLSNGAALDGTFRMHANGHDISQFAWLGAFSEYTVLRRDNVVKVAPDLPLREICVLACAVPTGWGSAVESAGVKPGDVTIVMGLGGIGMSAVQGAAHAGAARVIAVDPVEFKREVALTLGATDVFPSIDEAAELAKELTEWQGADNAVVAVGLTRSEHVAQAFSAVGKGGTVAVTGISGVNEPVPPVSIFELSMYQKRIQGVLYGGMSPNVAVPRLIRMYQSGHLKLAEMITRNYALDEINDAYLDMHAGRNVRGVIVYD
jgi:S-(hydroxymethyl)glutathione dehydrogenase/alcohol dehydrogenase